MPRKVTFSTEDLRSTCNSSTSIDMKIETIKSAESTYGTPGPSSLHAHARHTHLSNQTGIAWVYTDDENVCILALGKKDNSRGRTTSGYNWSERGNVSGLP